MYLLNYRPLIEELLEKAIDMETGEITDEQLLKQVESLEMEERDKIENLALEYKETDYMISALDEEIKKLKQRQHDFEQKAEKIQTLLGTFLGYNKFETPKVKISFRKSTSVEVVNEEDIPSEFKKEIVSLAKKDLPIELYDLIQYSDVKVSKNDIKKAINAGQEVKGVYLKENKKLKVI